jgi:hypothetical protein
MSAGRPAHPVRQTIIDIVAPVAVYYGARGLGASLWIALIAGAVLPSVSVLFGLITQRHVDRMGLLILAALAVSTAASLVSGSPRALLARDGLTTGAWAGYMYLSLLARRPATYVMSRPLLEGRRVFDPSVRRWVRGPRVSWDEIWERAPDFRRIWRVATVIWGSAILADAIARIVMAATLPVGLIPALGGALWPVTFVVLQVWTNVYFFRSGFWQLLLTGAGAVQPASVAAAG